jgi:LytR cell envelope-related transcriptional attenuator
VRGRHLTTAVTLVVLLGILAVGGLVGLRTLLAPLPAAKPSAVATPDCTVVRKGALVHARQVTVSVFNGGDRSGLADETMGRLRNRGFVKGDVGNAPSSAVVKRVQVWTTQAHDAAARLVARQFGKKTRVRVVDTDLGPGVDVVVGDAFTKLAKAKTVIVATRSSSVCRPGATATTGG